MTDNQIKLIQDIYIDFIRCAIKSAFDAENANQKWALLSIRETVKEYRERFRKTFDFDVDDDTYYTFMSITEKGLIKFKMENFL